MKKIAFIGLGNMGGPMAVNLLKGGFDLTVYDLSEAALKIMAEAGARPATSIADAVKDAEAVITMLPASEHAKKVYLDKDGVIAHAKKGALLIDSSTINADAAREIAKAASAAGFDMLDAPVSGGVAGAVSAGLTFIVGGEAAVIERARPLFAKMGKNVMHAGTSGAGQVAKICNNMLLGIMMIGTSEALNLGAANGLDPKVLSDIISKSSGRNWALEIYNPMPGVMDNVPASRGYVGGFGTQLMLKDLSLAQEAAQATHAQTPLGEIAWQLYQRHVGEGNAKLDFSSIFQMIAKNDG
ncbi:MAG: 3-hydroxyisobutyrate dehydrogenase [Alphaproteobacteria bacterium]